MNSVLICGKKKLSLDTPKIMGIINLNPASFSTKGRITAIDQLLSYAEKQIHAGASILDLGAEPTNPFVDPYVSEKIEREILLPAVEKIAKNFACVISVDTSKPAIMQDAIEAGADLINDVRALTAPFALELIAKHQTACCLMHMVYPYGKETGIVNPISENTIEDIYDFLEGRIHACLNAGIAREAIIIDPGIGGGNFGKNTHENLKILANVKSLKKLNLPIMLGVSRKTFIGEITGMPEENRVPASLAASFIGLLNGADIIRTHDVEACFQAMKFFEHYKTIAEDRG